MFPRSETLKDVVKHEVPGPGDAPPTSRPAPRLFPLTSNEQRRTLRGDSSRSKSNRSKTPQVLLRHQFAKTKKSRKVLTARSRPTTSSLFPLPPKPTRQHSGPTVPTNPPNSSAPNHVHYEKHNNGVRKKSQAKQTTPKQRLCLKNKSCS